MDPLSFYNDPGLAGAQQQSQQAGQAYKTAVTNASTMPDLLKQALDKKFSENNPLIQERSGAAANYLNEFTNAPQAVQQPGMIFNPQEQANLIQQRRSSALVPVMNANELLSWQQGGIQNTVGETTKMYQALVQSAAIEAENKRNSYMDLLDLISRKAQAAEQQRQFQQQQKSYDESIRQWNLQYELDKQKAAQSGGGLDLSGIFEWLNNQNNTADNRPPLDTFVEGNKKTTTTVTPTAIKNIKINPENIQRAAAPVANIGKTAIPLSFSGQPSASGTLSFRR